MTAAEKGQRLLRLLHRFPIEGFERSFKMAPGSLRDNRFLVGLVSGDIGLPELTGLCTELGMPRAYQVDFLRGLGRARAVHFGFEESESQGLYKAYIEFAVRAEASGSVLVHLAYKWNAESGEPCAIASYLWNPLEATNQWLSRVEAGYLASGRSLSFEALKAVVDLACLRCARPLMVLDVKEGSNSRDSFDVNLHPARLLLSDVEPVLEAMRIRYGIAEAAFRAAYESIASCALGHLSAGLNREGMDFMTFYYDSSAD